MILICWFKTFWRTLNSLWFPAGIYISGHDFAEQEDGTLECEVCGAKSKASLE